MPRSFEQFNIQIKDALPGISSGQLRLFFATKKIKFGDTPTKMKYEKNQYFLKKVEDSTHEVAIMEFYRLLIPQQPKYRSIQDICKDHYVQSKAIQGQTVFEMDKPSFLNQCSNTHYGTSLGMKGLGAIECISNYILYNIDEHLGNLIIDEHQQLYKIDGEHVYWQPLDVKELQILKENFNKLYGVNEIYTHEFNQVLLRFLVLPEILLHAFCQQYHVKDNDKKALLANQIFLRHLVRTKFDLDESFFPQFKGYISSEKALVELKDFIPHLQNFVTAGKNKLLSDHINLSISVIQNFEQLKQSLKDQLTIGEFTDLQLQPSKRIKNHQLQQQKIRYITLFRPIAEQMSGLILLLMSFGFVLLLYGGMSYYAHQFFVQKKYISQESSKKMQTQLLKNI